MTDDRARGFLVAAGWAGAASAPLAGDASGRRYERVTLPDRTAVLMLSTPDDPGLAAFRRIGAWLRLQGLSAPEILAADEPAGLLLLEDLGDDLLARLADRNPATEAELYRAAARLLGALHRCAVPEWLAPYTAERLGVMLDVTGQWYLPAMGAGPSLADGLPEAMTRAAVALVGGPPVMALRDFHAENLIWLPGRKGAAGIGLLDFQDAFAGHPAYDLASLLADVRRDLAPGLGDAVMAQFIRDTGHDAAEFAGAFALLSAQRNLRILGVFARLALAEGKTRYLTLLPRCHAHIRTALTHPALADIARIVARFPQPTPAAIKALAARCPTPSR